MSGSVSDIIIIALIILAVFWILSSANKYTGIDIKSYLEKSELTKPIVPIITMLQDASSKEITTQIGLIALIIIFLAILFGR